MSKNCLEAVKNKNMSKMWQNVFRHQSNWRIYRGGKGADGEAPIFSRITFRSSCRGGQCFKMSKFYTFSWLHTPHGSLMKTCFIQPLLKHHQPAGWEWGRGETADQTSLENLRFEMFFKFFKFVELSDSSAAQLLVFTYCDKPAMYHHPSPLLLCANANATFPRFKRNPSNASIPIWLIWSNTVETG